MTTVVFHRYRGFLVRVVEIVPGCSHPYEWTVEGIGPTRRTVRKLIEAQESRMRQQRWCRRPHPPFSTPEDAEFWAWYSRPRRLNSRLVRFYDPTSMPTARGKYGALSWGRDYVDDLINPPKPYRILWNLI